MFCVSTRFFSCVTLGPCQLFLVGETVVLGTLSFRGYQKGCYCHCPVCLQTLIYPITRHSKATHVRIQRDMGTFTYWCFEEVSCIPRCVSPLGCVPKKSWSYRIIHDLRTLFVKEMIETIIDLVQSNDYAITVDIKNRFNYVSVLPEHQHYQGFSWENKYYVWKCLPFSLSGSPHFVCKVFRPVVAYLRQRG